MAIKSMFFNAIEEGGVYDRVYDSEDFTGYLDKVVGNGVFNNPSDSLQVRAGTGMEVIVAKGQGWIDGHKMTNTADYPLSLDASDTLLDRIDSVIFYLDTTEREMGIEVLKGTVASSPVPPTLTRTDSRWEMCLANILVAHASEYITNFVITDTRPNTDVCGWVTGLIDQLDTSTLFQQYQAAYEAQLAVMTAWQETMREQFESWLETLTDQLQVETYIVSFDIYKENQTGAQLQQIPLQTAGYTYEPSDIICPCINGAFTPHYNVAMVDGVPTLFLNIDDTDSTGNKVAIRILKSRIGFTTIVGSDDSVIIGSDNSQIIGS